MVSFWEYLTGVSAFTKTLEYAETPGIEECNIIALCIRCFDKVYEWGMLGICELLGYMW